MQNEQSRELSVELSSFLTTEPVGVNEKRSTLLAARGLLEILIQRGVAASEQVSHGNYQTNLRCANPNSHKLLSTGKEKLRQCIAAIEQQATTLEQQIETFDDFYVARNTSRAGLDLLGDEISDHNRRIVEARKLAQSWKASQR